MAPRLLSEYPWVVVNLSCRLCGRRGRYRLARLAARYGPDTPLDRVLADLARDCPSWRTDPQHTDPRCGARFEDLDRLRPHDTPSSAPAPISAPAPVSAPVARQRAPAREDIPQRRPRAVPDPPGGPPMLSGWAAPRIVVSCDKCGRRDVYETATIRSATIGDVRLTDLRHSLTAQCPRVKARAMSDWCRARLEAEA